MSTLSFPGLNALFSISEEDELINVLRDILAPSSQHLEFIFPNFKSNQVILDCTNQVISDFSLSSLNWHFNNLISNLLAKTIHLSLQLAKEIKIFYTSQNSNLSWSFSSEWVKQLTSYSFRGLLSNLSNGVPAVLNSGCSRKSGVLYYEISLHGSSRALVGWTVVETNGNAIFYYIDTQSGRIGSSGIASKPFLSTSLDYRSGDTIGCYLDLNTCKAGFCYSGKDLGIAFGWNPNNITKISPAFLPSKDTICNVNLGQIGFMFRSQIQKILTNQSIENYYKIENTHNIILGEQGWINPGSRTSRFIITQFYLNCILALIPHWEALNQSTNGSQKNKKLKSRVQNHTRANVRRPIPHNPLSKEKILNILKVITNGTFGLVSLIKSEDDLPEINEQEITIENMDNFTTINLKDFKEVLTEEAHTKQDDLLECNCEDLKKLTSMNLFSIQGVIIYFLFQLQNLDNDLHKPYHLKSFFEMLHCIHPDFTDYLCVHIFTILTQDCRQFNVGRLARLGIMGQKGPILISHLVQIDTFYNAVVLRQICRRQAFDDLFSLDHIELLDHLAYFMDQPLENTFFVDPKVLEFSNTLNLIISNRITVLGNILYTFAYKHSMKSVKSLAAAKISARNNKYKHGPNCGTASNGFYQATHIIQYLHKILKRNRHSLDIEPKKPVDNTNFLILLTLSLFQTIENRNTIIHNFKGLTHNSLILPFLLRFDRIKGTFHSSMEFYNHVASNNDSRQNSNPLNAQENVIPFSETDAEDTDSHLLIATLFLFSISIKEFLQSSGAIFQSIRLIERLTESPNTRSTHIPSIHTDLFNLVHNQSSNNCKSYMIFQASIFGNTQVTLLRKFSLNFIKNLEYMILTNSKEVYLLPEQFFWIIVELIDVLNLIEAKPPFYDLMFYSVTPEAELTKLMLSSFWNFFHLGIKTKYIINPSLRSMMAMSLAVFVNSSLNSLNSGKSTGIEKNPWTASKETFTNMLTSLLMILGDKSHQNWYRILLNIWPSYLNSATTSVNVYNFYHEAIYELSKNQDNHEIIEIFLHAMFDRYAWVWNEIDEKIDKFFSYLDTIIENLSEIVDGSRWTSKRNSNTSLSRGIIFDDIPEVAKPYSKVVGFDTNSTPLFLINLPEDPKLRNEIILSLRDIKSALSDIDSFIECNEVILNFLIFVAKTTKHLWIQTVIKSRLNEFISHYIPRLVIDRYCPQYIEIEKKELDTEQFTGSPFKRFVMLFGLDTLYDLSLESQIINYKSKEGKKSNLYVRTLKTMVNLIDIYSNDLENLETQVLNTSSRIWKYLLCISVHSNDLKSNNERDIIPIKAPIIPPHLSNLISKILESKPKLESQIIGDTHLNDENLCTICYTLPQNAKFIPCGHQTCISCIQRQIATNTNICFFCKQNFTSYVELN